MRRENRGPSASACTPRGYQHRGGGFPGEAVPSPGHPRTRGRPLLLLFAADHPPQAVPRPCCAASGVGTEFLSKPGVLLSGLQLTEGRAQRRRVCTLAVSRAPLPRPRRPRRRQAHSLTSRLGSRRNSEKSERLVGAQHAAPLFAVPTRIFFGSIASLRPPTVRKISSGKRPVCPDCP